MAKKKMTKEDIKKIREMMEFLVKQKVSEKINKLLSDERKVYLLTGEKRDSIQNKTGFSAGKISKIWIGLEKNGLVVKTGKSYKKVI